jgi:DNA-binding NarL/FixJ family response regulator
VSFDPPHGSIVVRSQGKVALSQLSRVLFVVQQLMLLEGLTAAVRQEPDIEIVGASATFDHAIDLAATLQPDVVVLSIELEFEVGIEAARQIQRQVPNVAVVLIASSPDDSLVQQAVDSGSSALVLTCRSVTDLVVAIRAAARGHTTFPRGRLDQLGSRPGNRTGSDLLSPRELEILEMLAAGDGTASISDRLTLSPHTVRNHIRNLLTKLHTHSRLEAVVKAQSLGLISPPGSNQNRRE